MEGDKQYKKSKGRKEETWGVLEGIPILSRIVRAVLAEKAHLSEEEECGD